MWSSSAGTPVQRAGTVGLAYLSQVCTTYKYSIVEDDGSFTAITVIFGFY